MKIIQDGAPPVISWFNPINSFAISTISPSEIGVICTNLANELGHHLVYTRIYLYSPIFEYTQMQLIHI